MTDNPTTTEEQEVLKLEYDGSLIKDRFGYKFFGNNYNPLGVILSFQGKMEVTENLIDLEDALEKDYIYSDDAINFCWEIPNLNNLGAVFFQRLFNTYVSLLLRQFETSKSILISGDDILVFSENYSSLSTKSLAEYKTLGKKVSVSITKTLSNNITVGHLGINLFAGNKAPSFAGDVESLRDPALLKDFVRKVEHLFYSTLSSCFVATTKVI
jgi:hypothetical protein